MHKRRWVGKCVRHYEGRGGCPLCPEYITTGTSTIGIKNLGQKLQLVKNYNRKHDLDQKSWSSFAAGQKSGSKVEMKEFQPSTCCPGNKNNNIYLSKTQFAENYLLKLFVENNYIFAFMLFCIHGDLANFRSSQIQFLQMIDNDSQPK